jgi:hypothetical protein
MIGHPNLKGLWDMSDAVTDASGAGNNGTVIGSPTYVAGIAGKALSLSGTAQAFHCGNPASLQPTNEFTFCAWIYPRGSGSDAAGGNIVGKYSTSGWIFYLYTGAQGLYFQCNATGYNTSVNASLNTWTHVAVTRSTASNSIKIFKNGVQIYSNVNLTITDTGNFQVGSYGTTTTNQPFYGYIDAAQYYNGIALPVSDIKRIMQGLHPLTRS